MAANLVNRAGPDTAPSGKKRPIMAAARLVGRVAPGGQERPIVVAASVVAATGAPSR
jgi:hypothetical protein